MLSSIFKIFSRNQGQSRKAMSSISNTVHLPAKLSVLTWNIWFDDLEQSTRFQSILSICKELNPDILCFQEVIPSFIQKIRSSEYFTTNYSSSDVNLVGRTIGSYGVMTLCRRSLEPKFSFHSFPTIYGRKLLLTEFQFGEETCAVGNVHLESMSNHPTREKQLEICYKALKYYKSSILCGDFNFCSLGNYSGRGPLENASLARNMPGYTDMWPALKGTAADSDTGITFDSRENRMIGDRDERMRYDRICYRLLPNPPAGSEESHYLTTHFLPVHIQRVGNCPITQKGARFEARVSADSDCVVAAATTAADSNPTSNTNITSNIPSGFDTPPRDGARPLMVVARGCSNPVPLFPSDHYGLYSEFQLVQK